MKHTVIFEQVGRGKLGWTSTIYDVTHSAIVRDLKKHRAIASSGIDLEPLRRDGATNSETFSIVVGGFRTVGKVSVCPPSSQLLNY